MNCPECGTKVPDNIIICWNCGHCLDPRITELAVQRKNKK